MPRQLCFGQSTSLLCGGDLQTSTRATRGVLTSPTMSENADDSGFQVHTSKRGATHNHKRVYIGNLPSDLSDEVLKNELKDMVESKADVPNIDAVEIHRRAKTTHALVSCGPRADQVIAMLNRKDFHGQRLNVQREQRNGRGKNKKKSSFGGWAKPTPKAMPGFEMQDPPTSVDEATERIEKVVGDEFDSTKSSGGDELNTAIAATAAVSFMAAIDSPFGLMAEALSNDSTTAPQKLLPVDTSDDNDEGDFMARMSRPLSDLLADFGEEDPNWKSVEPTEVNANQDEKKNDEGAAPLDDAKEESMLTQHGKAPIHIEFTSFGYFHGAPKEVRNGLSPAQPLPPIDCREMPGVPPYLEWQDGQSGAVRRMLLQAPESTMRSEADRVSKEVFDSIPEAIGSGYGYVCPLNVTVYIGSHSGRHRSVLLCELTATALRKLLRRNDGGVISQPISVGTRHLHIERKVARSGRKSRYDDDEKDNDWVLKK